MWRSGAGSAKGSGGHAMKWLPDRNDSSWFVLLLGFIILALLVPGLSLLLSWVYRNSVPPSMIAPDLGLLKDGVVSQLRPEPEERFLFLTLSAITPFAAWWFTILALRSHVPAGQCRWLTGEGFGRIASFLPLVVAIALFYPLVDSDFIEALLGIYQDYEAATFVVPLATITSLIAAGIFCVVLVRGGAGFPFALLGRAGHLGRLSMWLGFIASVALTIAAWRLFGISRITLDQAWSISLDAALYALSQVVGGRTLLVDLPSQYGLFPEFLGPVFRVTGMSILKVSAAFALMQILSLAAVFSVLVRNIKSPGLLALSGLALVWITFGVSNQSLRNEEVYFQYWPIRFFWPAMSLWFVSTFISSRTLIRSGVVSLATAIGLLWNLDSGLAIWLAFGAFLFFHWLGAMSGFSFNDPAGVLGNWKPLDYAKAGALHIIIPVVVCVLFFLMLYFKANGSMNFGWAISYQAVFYKLGFMMIPLPDYAHPWMSVLGVYLLGILYTFRKWSVKLRCRRADIVGYLSLLGVGLFVYYQGRSHVLNLVTVCWPAVIIMAILADEAIRMVRFRLAGVSYLPLPVVALAVLMLMAGGFMHKIPALVAEALATIGTEGKFASSVVLDEVSFIKANSWPGRQCLILSRRQGILYTETELLSPVPGPGLVESMFRADDEILEHGLKQGALECIFLGVGKDSKVGLHVPLDQILLSYRIAGSSAAGNMLYLVSSRESR